MLASVAVASATTVAQLQDGNDELRSAAAVLKL
jgi:hypothetical protein